MADQVADVVEVGLGNGRFLLLYLGPFGDELFWFHVRFIIRLAE